MWRFEQRTFYIGVLKVKTHFGMPRGAKTSLTLDELEEVARHSDSKNYLQACTTSGRELLSLYAETTNRKKS